MGFFSNLFGNKKITNKSFEHNINNSEEDFYGIEKENAHKNAINLVPEEFFWSCADELSPFDSDEGDMALAEFREWKQENPNSETYECIKWTIESVSKIQHILN